LVFAAAHLVMKSVPMTKTPNMPMAVQLVALLGRLADVGPRCIQRGRHRAQAGQRQDRASDAGRGGSFQHVLRDRLGQVVELAVRTPHVVGGDQDREDDDAEADRDADGRDAGADPLRQETAC
jgi:hypothetical protein